MPSVLIADDHCLVSQALQRIIDQSECAITVGIAGTLRQTEELLADLQPDILLLDIAMPDGDGIDALPQMRQVAPHTRIIILTMYAESAVINRAVNANADGYILKNTDAGELINAIQIVADNEKYICHEALQILKTRRIGHFAGWDMLSATINTGVSEVSNISDTKFAVENAL